MPRSYAPLTSLRHRRIVADDRHSTTATSGRPDRSIWLIFFVRERRMPVRVGRGEGGSEHERIHGFRVPELTVPLGTTVTWINHDDDPHTVTSTANVFRSPGLDTDETWAYTFTRPGTYEYFCTLHPLMTGKVIVRSGS
jgi:plastocyanin